VRTSRPAHYLSSQKRRSLYPREARPLVRTSRPAHYLSSQKRRSLYPREARAPREGLPSCPLSFESETAKPVSEGGPCPS
jgi:hypothetical protein